MATAGEQTTTTPATVFKATQDALTKNSARVYQRAWDEFAQLLGLKDPAEAIDLLAKCSQAAGHAHALSYKGHLVSRGLSARSVNTKLAAIRSVARETYLAGLLGYVLLVDDVPTEAWR